jgi:hypothetical protein
MARLRFRQLRDKANVKFKGYGTRGANTSPGVQLPMLQKKKSIKPMKSTQGMQSRVIYIWNIIHLRN